MLTKGRESFVKSREQCLIWLRCLPDLWLCDPDVSRKPSREAFPAEGSNWGPLEKAGWGPGPTVILLTDSGNRWVKSDVNHYIIPSELMMHKFLKWSIRGWVEGFEIWNQVGRWYYFFVGLEMMRIKNDSWNDETFCNRVCFIVSDFFISAGFRDALLLFSSYYFPGW